MVRVQGKVKYAKQKGYFKVNQDFKTKKEADKFVKFIGKEGKVKITEYRKPKQKVRGLFGY